MTTFTRLSRSPRTLGTAMLAALAFSTMAPSAAAQTDAPPPSPIVSVLPHVQLSTSMGDIILEIDTARAPVTAGNFLKYVAQKRLDGTVFYRAMVWEDWQGPGQGLIQGGTRGDAKKVLPPIKHEPTNITGLTHVAGTISMARAAPGTATGDFFIMLSPVASFDANPAGTGDTAGYAAFGRVVAGMDVVRQISTAPISPTLGEGVMRGQMIAQPVVIRTARKVAAPAPSPPTPTTPAQP